MVLPIMQIRVTPLTVMEEMVAQQFVAVVRSSALLKEEMEVREIV